LIRILARVDVAGSLPVYTGEGEERRKNTTP
jgi:hypothetical protein